MARAKRRWPQFPKTDGRLVLALVAIALLLGGWAWLKENCCWADGRG